MWIDGPRSALPVYLPVPPTCETYGGEDWRSVVGVLDALLVADQPVDVQRRMIAVLRAVAGSCIAPLEPELRQRGLWAEAS